MSKSLTIVLVLILSSVIYFSTGCKKDNEPQTVEYVMQVDSAVHADTIKVGEKFEIYFYGPIGPNNCYSFLRFEPGFGVNAMNFTLYGSQIVSDTCGGTPPRYLDGGGVAIDDMTVGEWTILVNQPAGVTQLNSKVIVIE